MTCSGRFTLRNDHVRHRVYCRHYPIQGLIACGRPCSWVNVSFVTPSWDSMLTRIMIVLHRMATNVCGTTYHADFQTTLWNRRSVGNGLTTFDSSGCSLRFALSWNMKKYSLVFGTKTGICLRYCPTTEL